MRSALRNYTCNQQKDNPLNYHPFPILEFDPDPTAIIEPHKAPIDDFPARCVICFFHDVVEQLAADGYATPIGELGSEMGRHAIYAHCFEHNGSTETVALFAQGVGAPLAAAFLDELIHLGARKIIACGGAGVLDRDIVMGHLVVPTAAVRDEGTSYHYLPPSREVLPSAEAVRAIESTLRRHNVDYLLGKAWTTDAIYRETRAKMQHRREEGCLVVDMEASAMFAVAQFRGVQFGQILYGGDNLDADEWDNRGWQKNWSVREKLVALAAEACLAL